MHSCNSFVVGHVVASPVVEIEPLDQVAVFVVVGRFESMVEQIVLQRP